MQELNFRKSFTSFNLKELRFNISEKENACCVLAFWITRVHNLPVEGCPDFVHLVLLICLKGVFAKNERGYRLNAIKKRF